MAVQAIYPKAQVTIGPVIEDGFYYDFAFERPFTPEDLEKFEAKMKEIAAADLKVTRRVMERDAAVAAVSRAWARSTRPRSSPAFRRTSRSGLYGQGEWFDLCRGPHVPSTGKLKAFKLMKVAGAYWRGDSRNEMLQRIYGTAWLNDKDLKEYLHAAGRSREARSPAHRQGSRSVSFPGRGAGRGVLASEGLAHLPAAHRLHARAPGRGRLRRGERAGDHGIVAVAEVRPPGEVRREHVPDEDARRARVRHQAHELPGAHPDLQPGHPLL